MIMETELDIDFTKSAQENASDYFSKSKQAKKKAQGAAEAIKQLEKGLELKKKLAVKEHATRITKTRKKEWYEKFHWFFTSTNMLAIGGKDAVQNEAINSKYFDEKDLFFHADIFGAPVVILKNGTDADKNTKEEVAQFAACFSRAWDSGMSSVDVYCLHRNQVSKSSNKGYLATGSFLMSGEREWFKGMPLELYAFVEESEEGKAFKVVPGKTYEKLKLKNAAEVKPGRDKKSDAAKQLSKKLGFDDIDYIMQQLPSGSFQVK